MRITQKKQVLNQLKGGKPITTLAAYDNWGITRLPDRIRDLRLDGHKIQSKMIEVRNRFGDSCRVAQYTMAKS